MLSLIRIKNLFLLNAAIGVVEVKGRTDCSTTPPKPKQRRVKICRLKLGRVMSSATLCLQWLGVTVNAPGQDLMSLPGYIKNSMLIRIFNILDNILLHSLKFILKQVAPDNSEDDWCLMFIQSSRPFLHIICITQKTYSVVIWIKIILL